MNDRKKCCWIPGKIGSVLAVVLALSFAASGGASAMEKQFPEGNFAITIPDDWHFVTNFPPGRDLITFYTDTNGYRTISLMIDQKRPSGPLDDRFITDYEKEIEKSGEGHRLSGKYIDIGGVKSYERMSSVDAGEKHISTLILLVPSEDCYCSVRAMRFDGDVSQDPEIQQIIGSFRFLHPFVPSYRSDLAAIRNGKLMEALTAIIGMAGFVFFSLSTLRSRRTRRLLPPSPSRPPPLPPGTKEPA